MPDPIHVTPAANLEDVVLARALADVPSPRALLVADRATRLSGAVRGLLDAGWTCAFQADGAPSPAVADAPVVHVALVAAPDDAGALAAATAVAPWVLVVDSPLLAAEAAGWDADLEAAGYTLRQADGRTRYYLAADHAELAHALSYPAGPGDAYVTDEVVRLRRQVDELTAEVVRWRTAALERWAVAQQPVVDDARAQALERELSAVRQTLSWRVTAPLRAVRRRGGR